MASDIIINYMYRL